MLSLEENLRQGLIKMNQVVSDQQVANLLTYVARLEKWNQRFNLTAVRTPAEMVGRHLLDSLSIAPYVQGSRVIDVGTGAGLPGIPLAIMYPDIHFCLLDKNLKKQIFVSQSVKSLSLKNVSCVSSSVQAYKPSEKFSTIVTRAFAPVCNMIDLTRHLLENGGQWLAMLGKADSLGQVPFGFELVEMIALAVPGEQAQRHLGIIKERLDG
jgi:16S rRNA (guanine527-N7)-methyltransferase